MNKLSLFKRGRWGWAIATVAILAIIGATSFAINSNGSASAKSPSKPSTKTVTVWIQASDSCSTALPGISFTASGPGVAANTVSKPTGGTKPQTIPTYSAAPAAQRHCPWTQRTCVSFSTGCTSIALNVPSSGAATYTITPKTTNGYLTGIVLIPKTPAGRNYAYVDCEGGSDCRFGGEVATVHVTSSGKVSASTQNIEPDGFKDAPWPSTGAQNGPLMFSFFGASGPNDFAMTCHNDGTHLLRDHMTGTPNWPHCNSGR